MPRFSEEYYRATSHANPHWKAVRFATFAVTLGRDTIAPWLKARDVDHLTYRHLGREIPFIDVVPLSRTTHRIVTIGRKLPFMAPFINFTLRMSYAIWLTIWISIAFEIAWLAGCHVPHPSFAYLSHIFTEARTTVLTIVHLITGTKVS